MLTENQSSRLCRVSQWCLLLACVSLAGIPCGCYALGKLSPHMEGTNGFNILFGMIGIVYVGSGIAGCFALASLGCGVACARQKRHVLFWTVPLWLIAGYGLVSGLCLLAMFLDSKLQFIPSGKRDDFCAILAIWFGGAIILSLASWLSGRVYGKRIKYFPWWSVPLWSTALFAIIMVFM